MVDTTLVNLHVHHLIRRRDLGPDALENLTTLCVGCHGREHMQFGRACRVEAIAL
jgi:5-methylcytosine-specific restriction endonuclease McrA